MQEVKMQILGKIEKKWNSLNWKGKAFVAVAVVAVAYGVVQGVL
jgi:hypothetical protein